MCVEVDMTLCRIASSCASMVSAAGVGVRQGGSMRGGGAAGGRMRACGMRGAGRLRFKRDGRRTTRTGHARDARLKYSMQLTC